jgi:Transposase DDE domain
MLADHWTRRAARYTGAAIQTSVMLRAAFKLPLRQIEGLMTSVLSLMGLTISAPDHTTVSRRAVTLPVIQATSVPHGPVHVLIASTGLQIYGAGQWLEAKHGAKSRRKWRKLHLAVDAASGMTVAQTLTDHDTDDPSQVAPLLGQIDDPIGQVTADSAIFSLRSTRTEPVSSSVKGTKQQHIRRARTLTCCIC